jgi:CDP-paratose 2-epimerase
VKLLVTGICGFVGSTVAHALLDHDDAVEVVGVDNFIRSGSEINREALRNRGVKLVHGDIRCSSDLEMLPAVDWIIDAAANASVLAGVDGQTSSRQLVEHNLYGTVNILELAKKHRAGCILLSTSRVYSIKPLAELAVEEANQAYRPAAAATFPEGLSDEGIAENFSTAPPVSLYGSTKIASEALALEYGDAFEFPVWVNRCGVMAGAGQFGRPDQGIFAFWINAYLRNQPLKYIGFGGHGFQTRDALHPRDMVSVLLQQMRGADSAKPRVVNLSGGTASARSLAQLSEWCAARFGQREIGVDAAPRPFDLPWVVLDSRLAKETWNWEPQTPIDSILEEIAAHAEANPRWLEISAPR